MSELFPETKMNEKALFKALWDIADIIEYIDRNPERETGDLIQKVSSLKDHLIAADPEYNY